MIRHQDHVGLARLGANQAFRTLARVFGPSCPTREELLGAAYLGVEIASRTFEESRGLKFSTLAVRNAYFMALRAGQMQLGFRNVDQGRSRVRRMIPATDLRFGTPDDEENGTPIERLAFVQPSRDVEIRDDLEAAAKRVSGEALHVLRLRSVLDLTVPEISQMNGCTKVQEREREASVLAGKTWHTTRGRPRREQVRA